MDGTTLSVLFYIMSNSVFLAATSAIQLTRLLSCRSDGRREKPIKRAGNSRGCKIANHAKPGRFDSQSIPDAEFKFLSAKLGKSRSELLRSHFCSSGCFAQSDAQAVSDLALTSTHFGRIVMSPRLSQQPTHRLLLLSLQFDPQPHEITVPDETQHSSIRTLVPHVMAVLILPCVVPLVMPQAMASRAPACLPAPAHLSRFFFASWLSARPSSSQFSPTASRAFRRQLRELTDVTNRTTRRFRLAPAKGCRIYELRLEQTAFSEPNPQRECRHFPASREKTKAILVTGTASTRRMVSTRRRVPLQCCARGFGLLPSLILIKIPTRSSCKQGSDNARLGFQSKATCQQVLAANSGKWFILATENPLAVHKSADVFVRQTRAFDERQMEKRLAPLWNAANKFTMPLFKMPH